MNKDLLLALHTAISRECKLTTTQLWIKDGTPCAIGALHPPEMRKYISEAFVQYKSKYYDCYGGIYPVDELSKIAQINNDFIGSPANRRNYMLKVVEDFLKSEHNIVIGSDLEVPNMSTKEIALVG